MKYKRNQKNLNKMLIKRIKNQANNIKIFNEKNNLILKALEKEVKKKKLKYIQKIKDLRNKYNWGFFRRLMFLFRGI